MKVKISILLAAAALLLMGFYSYQETDHPGKKVFMDSKCITCHTVTSEDITMKTQKKNVVDLSDVGTTYRANFLEKFLKKEEKKDDKAHPSAFKGTDEQLEQLVEWLTTLKTADTDTKSDGTGGIKEPKPKSEIETETDTSGRK